MKINGTTKPIAILGTPIGHTLSPLMHNFFFQATGLNNVYIPLVVKESQLETAIRGLWSLGFIGANITIPFKEKVLKHLIEIDEEARLIGAVNTLVSSTGGYKGYNTDGRGFINSLLEGEKWNPKDKRVVILGAGGSARAVGTVLALEGVHKIIIVNRTLAKAKEITDKILSKMGTKAEEFTWDDKGLKNIISDSDLIVNTTPLGMKPYLEEAPPLNSEWLSSGQLVVDLIYNPLTSKFLENAAKQGCETLNGLGMLIHQGALSFELWTGEKPPLDGVGDLLEKELTGSGKPVSMTVRN